MSRTAAQSLPASAYDPALAAARRRVTQLERQLAWRRDAEQAHRRQADTLLGLLSHLAATPRVDTAVDHVLSTIARQLEAPLVVLWLARDADARLQCDRLIDRTRGALEAWDRAAIPDAPAHVPALRTVLTTRRPVVVGPAAHAQLDGAIDPAWLSARRVQSLLLVPLVLGQTIVGVYASARQSPRPFGHTDRQLGKALAHHATLAVQLGRLSQATGRAAVLRAREQASREIAERLEHDMAVLCRTTASLASQPDLECFLGDVMTAMADQADAIGATLWLSPGDGMPPRRHLALCDGVLYRDPPDAPPVPCPETLATRDWHQIAWQRSWGHTIDGPLDPRSAGPGVSSTVSLPLVIGSQTLGIVTLWCRASARVDSEPRELIWALAQQATLAVHLTRLGERARNAAVLRHRTRLVQDVHGLLATHFIDIVGEVAIALERLAAAPHVGAARLRRAQARARSALAQTRRAAWSLRPDVLDYRELGTALERLAARAATPDGPVISAEVEGSAWPLRDEVVVNLFRIADEVLANALRHAGARTIRLRLHYGPSEVTFAAADDGCGFDLVAARELGEYGLTSLRERTERIGGTLRIDTQEGRGTSVTVIVSRRSAA